jgi:tetratricopeptide (TPR) repeat protein
VALDIVPTGVVFQARRAGQPWPPPVVPADALDGEHDPRVPKDHLTQNLIGHFHHMLGFTFRCRRGLRALAGDQPATPRERQAPAGGGPAGGAARGAGAGGRVAGRGCGARRGGARSLAHHRRLAECLEARGEIVAAAPPAASGGTGRDRERRGRRGRDAPHRRRRSSYATLVPRRLAVTLACLLALGACRSSSPPGRVIVLGLDGMDPETVDLLMSEGKLPHFARLRQEGAYGKLESSKPMLSPILWTTIATGKPPDQHGIGHFVAVNEKTGEQLPVTSAMRKVKAVWNVLSDAGRIVDVVGWWATWPPETVRGAVVSDHTCYHFLFAEGATGGKPVVATTHPPGLEAELAPMIRRPGDVTREEAARFVRVSDEDFARPFSFEDDLGHFRWALATADTYRRIGLHLWRTQRPDVLMVYVEGTDSTAHLFGHLFRAGTLAGELARQQERYGNAVEEMYRYADGILGDFMAAMDERTTLVVLSDHGFQLGVLPDDPSKTRDMRRVSERYHRMDGILYLFGNRVKPRARIDGAKQLDVTPTLLTLAGLSPAADMPGRVLAEALDVPAGPRAVATYETGTRVAAAGAPDAAVDPQILERLRSLGYVGAQSPQGDRNLAAMLFQSGRWAEAAEAYDKLVREKPDDGELRASLAGALGALGRYDQALVQLGEAIRLAPVNPEAYHNRGAIYERKGDPKAAVEEYRTALRYNPQYEPSQQALTRLGAAPSASQPQNPAQQLAAGMAERASQAARRGDYQEAMKILDEAARVAPRYALVQQYRANVAYLMGDTETAKTALRRALEIEPDNALFKANLERLERGARR